MSTVYVFSTGDIITATRLNSIYTAVYTDYLGQSLLPASSPTFAGLNVSGVIHISGTTVIDASRNLTNTNSLAFTDSTIKLDTGAANQVRFVSSDATNVKQFWLGGGAGINISMAGTLGCGAITSTGSLTLDGATDSVLSNNGGALNIGNSHGYVKVGCLNATACHMYTDAPFFAFNANVSPSVTNSLSLGSSGQVWGTSYIKYSNVTGYISVSETTGQIRSDSIIGINNVAGSAYQGLAVLSLRIGASTTVIDSSANLTNIGTVGCGAITSSGNPILPTTAASATIQYTNDAEVTTLGTSYALVKAIQVNTFLRSCRVSYAQKIGSTSATCYVAIYRNGTLVAGTPTTNSTTSYVSHTYDLTYIFPGESIQLYMYTTNASYPAYVQTFDICFTKTANTVEYVSS